MPNIFQQSKLRPHRQLKSFRLTCEYQVRLRWSVPFRRVGLHFDLHCPITAGKLSWVLWAVAALTSVTDSTDSSWLWLMYDTITLRFSGLTSKISFSSVYTLTLLRHLLSLLLFTKWMEVRKVCHLKCPSCMQQSRWNTTCQNNSAQGVEAMSGVAGVVTITN